MTMSKCEFCNDTGWVDNVEYNSDVHTFMAAGKIVCTHPQVDEVEREMYEQERALDHFNDEKI